MLYIAYTSAKFTNILFYFSLSKMSIQPKIETQCNENTKKNERCIVKSKKKCIHCYKYYCGRHMDKHLSITHHIDAIESSVKVSSKSEEMKSELGQYMTTNSKEILKDFSIPENFRNIVIEPFAGEGHLVLYYELEQEYAECYDIEPKKSFIKKRDTLLHPPSFGGKYLITNPPYCAKNKSTNKEIYEKYREDDLYKCFLRIVIRESMSGRHSYSPC